MMMCLLSNLDSVQSYLVYVRLETILGNLPPPDGEVIRRTKYERGTVSNGWSSLHGRVNGNFTARAQILHLPFFEISGIS
eukprot:768317-Hanusia_phi.AAC.3